MSFRNTIDPTVGKGRKNAGKSYQESVPTTNTDNSISPVTMFRKNAGKVYESTPSQQIIEVVKPQLMRVGGKLRGSGSGGAIADRNPINFGFNNNLNNDGTDSWAARFLNPTLIGGASYSTTAKSGSHSLALSGGSQYLACTSFSGDFLSLGADDFSFDLDLYFNTLASPPYTFFSKHSGGGINYSFMCLYSDTNNRITWVKNGLYTTITNNTLVINTATWYNLKIVRSGNTTRFYWDNNLLPVTYDETISRNGNVNYNSNATQLWIGRNGDGAWGFNGLIDNFKFYKRAII